MLDFPNAKINLGLFITKKREDGFHNLQSVFVPVGWTDVLEILPSQTGKTEMIVTGISIETTNNNEDNLCLKAYQLLQKAYNLPAVHIHLHKNIPIGAGLGGGSADASFTVKMLNKMFDLKLSDEQMEDNVRTLGSDCAFFIKNKPMFCFEKGDKFKNIELNMREYLILLVYPNLHIPTKEAYTNIQPYEINFDISNLVERKDFFEWKNLLHNDFENSLFPKYPVLNQLKESFYEMGAVYAAMSGSGSTIFGIFEKNKLDFLQELRAGYQKEYKTWLGEI